MEEPENRLRNLLAELRNVRDHINYEEQISEALSLAEEYGNSKM